MLAEITVTLALMRGSMMKFLPVNFETVLISARISASLRFSVISFANAEKLNSSKKKLQAMPVSRGVADLVLKLIMHGVLLLF